MTLRAQEAGEEQPITLPAGAVASLMRVLEAMAAGRGVTIIPENAELTTFEAADVLKVSRPYLVKPLDAGSIPYRKVGRHRRIRREDVLAYKAHNDRKRDVVMDQLVREAQERGEYDLR